MTDFKMGKSGIRIRIIISFLNSKSHFFKIKGSNDRWSWKQKHAVFRAFDSDLADAPRGCVSGCRRSRGLHSGWIVLWATLVWYAAPPVKGFPLQQCLQTAAINCPKCIPLYTQLQICCTQSTTVTHAMAWHEHRNKQTHKENQLINRAGCH